MGYLDECNNDQEEAIDVEDLMDWQLKEEVEKNQLREEDEEEGNGVDNFEVNLDEKESKEEIELITISIHEEEV